MALDAVTLGAAKKYTDEKVQQIVVDGGGVSPEERDNIDKNTKARHSHSNKETLDLFGINTAKTRPTFADPIFGQTETLATQYDVTSRVNELRDFIPNSATFEGSTLKIQRKIGEALKDLFSVEFPTWTGGTY